MLGSRFQTFVALRYLMAKPIHVSWLALAVAGVFWFAAAVLYGVASYLLVAPDPHALVPHGDPIQPDLIRAAQVCLGLGAFVIYVFLVRLFFTFYSTVSIVGLSIGGSALVIVLSVMNGFESDLREKILGSNAHIQVSKEEGEFLEWESVRARIDKVKGVVGSTPFATSEVVIAANSNYFNVVVKGIDVDSAVKVTDLAKDLKSEDDVPDPDALERLEPLVKDDSEPTKVIQLPSTPSTGPVIDPAPPDMQTGGGPIDFSGGGDDDDSAKEPKDPKEQTDTPGGDKPIDKHDGDDKPIDKPDGEDKPIDKPILREPRDNEPPRGTSRVPTLHGVLVGRELRKQIHTFTGQEVRLVSPLADPMNVDALGTPIPYNRDYRVAGEFYTGMYEYDLKLVYVSLESLQTFLRMGDAVDGIEIRIRDADDVDTVVSRLQKELGPTYRVQGWRELNRNLFSALKLEKIAMFLVLAIIILVASFSIVGTLIVTVIEKGKEIALIKTLGASDGGIVGVFVIQGLLIGLIGTALGVGLGLAGAAALAHFGFPLEADVYYINRLPIEVDPVMVALVAAAGLLISVAATIYPAILAAQLRPAEGLKM